jgi:hypothetical protein
VYFSANAAELHEGHQWYDNAREVCQHIADNTSLSLDTVVGVLAALSPNNRWDKNVADTERLIKVSQAGEDTDLIKVSTYGKNKEKAIRILTGESPNAVLGGLKVRAFYRCILGSDAVCIDGHAYAIWAGERISTTKTPSISPKLYAAIANDYRIAAERISQIKGVELAACQVQAVTWVVWRNHFGGKRK